MTDKPVTYVYLHRNKFLTIDAKSLEEMATILHATTEWLDELIATGKVTLDPGGVSDDYAHFITTDSEVAAKYHFIDAHELWGDEDEEDEELEDEDEDDSTQSETEAHE